MMSVSNIPKYLYVSISPNVLVLSWFGSSIPSIISHFPLFIIIMAHVLCEIPFLYLHCISSLSVEGFSIILNFWLTVWSRPCTLGGWFFSGDLWSLYTPVHFQSMWLSRIIDITNCIGDSASSRKIPFWIFTSAKIFPPVISCTPQFSMVFLINFITSLDLMYILWSSIIKLRETIAYASVVNPRHS